MNWRIFTMKIAVTYDNGNVFQHFGKTENFKVYEVEDNKVVSSEVIGSNGTGHGALAGLLAEQGINVLICGGIGGGAQTALTEAGIEMVAGAQGNTDDVVEAYLKGELVSTGANCDHHHHEEGHEHHHEEHEHHHEEHEHHHEEHGHHHHHHHEGGEVEEYGIGTFVYYRRPAFDIHKFDHFIATRWSRNIIRAKGVCYFSHNRDMSYLFEQAGTQKQLTEAGLWYATAPEEDLIELMRQEPGLMRDWDEKYGDRMQKIVFIGQHMDKEQIIRDLDACLE